MYIKSMRIIKTFKFISPQFHILTDLYIVSSPIPPVLVKARP